ncbi:MAG: PHP domain-containing protein [bacterium]|nr:PHP domain-containing protein [bacterium]
MIIDICEKSGCDKSTSASTLMKKTNIKEKINMENYKTSPQVWLEKQDFEDKSAMDTLNRLYFDNIIKPYRESDKIIDLHTHTNYSDGDLSPYELIRLAIEKRVGILGITDHDTLDGIKQIDKTNSLIVDSGIQIIDGVELSAKVSKGRMHILGYDIDINNVNINKEMEKIKDNSINSVLSIMEQIKRDYGIVFGYSDIKELVNSNHNLGRPDLAKLCIKYGYASSIQDAFNKYLIEAYNKTRSTSKGLSYQECIELILQSKGIPILAHPKSLELPEKEFLILLKEMINSGLKGIEVYHSSHTEEEIKYYLEIANKYDLLISGGSDYHGKTIKPDIELGTGKNNGIRIKKLSLLDKLNK